MRRRLERTKPSLDCCSPAAECHAQRPPIPVVLVTGSADVTQESLSEADAILPKPFELGQLLQTVSRLARVHAHR